MSTEPTTPTCKQSLQVPDDLEACVRDERWNRWCHFWFGLDNKWHVLEFDDEEEAFTRHVTGPHDTILAAAQAAIESEVRE